MELIENYEKALKEIYDHVGFVEDWVVYPICDETDKYWYVNGDDEEVVYGDSVDKIEEQKGDYYCDEIYKQRFYDKWIYEGELITMIFCNPGVDGMKYFKLFDNNKKIKL